MDDPNNDIAVRFHELLVAMQLWKPNNRTAADRAFAIVITMVEQAFAYYTVFAHQNKENDNE